MAVLGLATLALTSTVAGASSGLASGLHGVVMRGPTRPVCRVNEPCEERAKGLLLQFKRDGKVRAQVRTNDRGRYSVILRPGRYVATTPHLRPSQDLTPHLVSVPRGRPVRADFHLDTGIQ